VADLVEAAEASAKGAARAHCFTYNKWDQKTQDLLQSLVLQKQATYLVYQIEVAPETGHEHLQGYVEWGGPQKATRLGTLCGGKPHMEKRHGSPQQASDYCKKADSRKDGTAFFEAGELSKQGKRNDLLDVKQKLDAGCSQKEVADFSFAAFVKYHKAFALYRELSTKKRSQHTICIVIWGAPRSGKSSSVNALFPDAYWVDQSNAGLWMDRYEQQECVVFDELTGWMRFSQFKRLIDMTPVSCEGKGTTKEFTSRYIVFTSNERPDEWYEKAQSQGYDQTAFRSRIHFNIEACEKVTLGEAGRVPTGDFVMKVHQAKVPFFANLPDHWQLKTGEGITEVILSSEESHRLLKKDLTVLIREEDEVITATLRLQLRSDGVILYPSLRNHGPNGVVPFRDDCIAFITYYLLQPQVCKKVLAWQDNGIEVFELTADNGLQLVKDAQKATNKKLEAINVEIDKVLATLHPQVRAATILNAELDAAPDKEIDVDEGLSLAVSRNSSLGTLRVDDDYFDPPELIGAKLSDTQAAADASMTDDEPAVSQKRHITQELTTPPPSDDEWERQMIAADKLAAKMKKLSGPSLAANVRADQLGKMVMYDDPETGPRKIMRSGEGALNRKVVRRAPSPVRAPWKAPKPTAVKSARGYVPQLPKH